VHSNIVWSSFAHSLFARFSDIGDEYMFGPALLIAPVTEQGMTTRSVYLPEGSDWYNFWTNERIHGGQRITAQAPIDTIPVFVRAGSILPLGTPIQSTNEKQAIEKVRIYPGADAHFTLYSDDGKTYAYERGQHDIIQLDWNDSSHKLSHKGPTPWAGPDANIVELVRSR